MIVSRGCIYRWGVRIKELGERIGHVKVRGCFILDWLAAPIIAIGLSIKGCA